MLGNDGLQLGGGVPAEAADLKPVGTLLQQCQQQVVIARLPREPQLGGNGGENMLEQGAAGGKPFRQPQ